jgi:Zn-dependent peptidase ImmA (M78 family)
VLEARRASERRALALDLLHDLGEAPLRFQPHAKLDEDPEQVGQRIRDTLAVTGDAQSRWRDADGRLAFRAWRQRIEDVGVLVFQATPISTDVASGFAIAEDLLPVIVVNRKDVPTGRTFSLLHEFAHLMLGVSGVSDADITDAARPPEEQSIEVFCNHAAAAALIPAPLLLNEERVAAHGSRATDWTDAEIDELARGFGVSRDALLRRLLTFGRTTEDFYRQKRGQYLAWFKAQQDRKRAEVGEGGIPRNMPQETVSNYGQPLVRIILENYFQDRVSLM